LIFNNLFYNFIIGGQNFPECDFGVHWIVIENVVETDTFTSATMKNLLNQTINPKGNAKELYTMKEDDKLFFRNPIA